MSRFTDSTKEVRKLVVIFDICSSTTLLEDLLRTENAKRWRNLLIGIKKYLCFLRKHVHFEIYKFMGDGWVILFDDKGIKGTDLMLLLNDICTEYQSLFHNGICEVLEGNDYHLGLTYGIDSGILVQITMNGRVEYIGRPLNIASRLQSCIETNEKSPRAVACISKNAFVSLGLSRTKKYQGKLIEKELKNISGGKRYQARQIIIQK